MGALLFGQAAGFGGVREHIVAGQLPDRLAAEHADEDAMFGNDQVPAVEQSNAADDAADAVVAALARASGDFVCVGWVWETGACWICISEYSQHVGLYLPAAVCALHDR